MNARRITFLLVGFFSLLFLVPQGATAEERHADGSFCISGVVSRAKLQRDPDSTTACGLYESNVVAVTIDLNGGARVVINKHFSPDSVLCASRTLRVGSPVAFCGILSGYIVNAGTANEAWGWNLYPARLTKP